MRRLACALAVASALAGCGDRTPSDEEQIRSLLATFQAATEKHDYDTLCNKIFAPALLTGLQQIGLPCEIAMRQSFEDVKNPRMTVGQITIRGDKASAQIRTSAEGQAPSSDVLELQRVKGAWKVSALGGGREPAPTPSPAP
jgi:stress response protein SCP2